MCRRSVTVDGRRYTCSHPDLKRPLTAGRGAGAFVQRLLRVAGAAAVAQPCSTTCARAPGLPPVRAGRQLRGGARRSRRARASRRARCSMCSSAWRSGSRIGRVADGARRRAGCCSTGCVAPRRTARHRSSRRGISPRWRKPGPRRCPADRALGIVVALDAGRQRQRAPSSSSPPARRVAMRRRLQRICSRTIRHRRRQLRRRGHRLRVGHHVRVGVTGANGSRESRRWRSRIYVARVLAGEGQPRAADAAQQALAIAIRTFALANRNRHRSEGLRLVRHDALPGAAAGDGDDHARAAEATAGRVLVHQSQPAQVFYSAWCGGRSELASEVWPGAIDYAFEPRKTTTPVGDEPGWTSEMSAAEHRARAARRRPARRSAARPSRRSQRTRSGRVSRLARRGLQPAGDRGPRLSHGGRSRRRMAAASRARCSRCGARRRATSLPAAGSGTASGCAWSVRAVAPRAARPRMRFCGSTIPGLRVEHVSLPRR